MFEKLVARSIPLTISLQNKLNAHSKSACILAKVQLSLDKLRVSAEATNVACHTIIRAPSGRLEITDLHHIRMFLVFIKTKT